DDLQVDDMAMMLCDTVVVFDHAKNLLRGMVMAGPDGYDAAVQEIERILPILQGPLPALPADSFMPHEPTANVDQATFEGTVRRIKQYLTEGDGIQMV